MPRLFRLLAPASRTIVRDSFPLRLDDGRTIEVARVRHPRARRLRLSVDERGARLTLPPRASLESGERFAGEQREWVAAQLDRFAPASAVGLVAGETVLLPLRGELVPLAWRAGRYACVRREAGQSAARRTRWTRPFAMPAYGASRPRTRRARASCFDGLIGAPERLSLLAMS